MCIRDRIVTARALAAGSGTLTAEAVTEMMRVTHTLKGSAGTVGLHGVVDLAHRLESALAPLRVGSVAWSTSIADKIVEIADGMRTHVDAVDAEQGALLAERVRAQIDELAKLGRDGDAVPRAVDPIDSQQQ